jgi:hypothetical protein
MDYAVGCEWKRFRNPLASSEIGQLSPLTAGQRLIYHYKEVGSVPSTGSGLHKKLQKTKPQYGRQKRSTTMEGKNGSCCR